MELEEIGAGHPVVVPGVPVDDPAEMARIDQQIAGPEVAVLHDRAERARPAGQVRGKRLELAGVGRQGGGQRRQLIDRGGRGDVRTTRQADCERAGLSAQPVVERAGWPTR
ncbi:MAG TPA: hypothetical protein VEY96_13800 [Actinomycetes bacterium]|nr:hypothetical protein [Actinomycetes bacterium]